MIGILAIQGDYEAHAKMLAQLHVSYCFVKTVTQLNACRALIIPGGESTTLLHFISRNGLFDAMIQFAQKEKPIFGTCAGAILLAKTVKNPTQKNLGLMNITIERNSYGRQMESMIAKGQTSLSSDEEEMVFIRAPKILNVGDNVEVLATYQDHPVFVREGHCLAATFHPELSKSLLWHRYFDQLSS